MVAGGIVAFLLAAQGAPQDAVVEPKKPASVKTPIGDLQPDWGGFKIAESEFGSLSLSAYTYIRYLNQRALDDTSTDSFGRTRELDKRNDLQIQKVKIDTRGWLATPELLYNLWIWTSNPTMGQGAQVVVAGNLAYVFDPAFSLGMGINPLPTTRSIEGSWPRFHKVDSRTMADEYMRGSYTTGIWGRGTITEGLAYKVMLGNNLSQLGVDAVQLDGTFDTVCSALVWMPTTGEYGPYSGMGDVEFHERAATRIGVHYTHSTEDRQSQPNAEDPENTQIRLSDGTAIFDLNALAPNSQVLRARYQMFCADVGLKVRGFSFEAEYFVRWVTDFRVTGTIPLHRLFDQGFQVQTSYMVSNTLQLYVSPSKIFGKFGDPWDVSVGANWYPILKEGFRRNFRVNAEVVYMRDSPVGYSSIQYLVGGTGPVFNLNVEFFF
jgi:hypothetical protein